MSRRAGYLEWPLDIPRSQAARYMAMWRLIQRHRGPLVRTLTELERAMRTGEIFYIVPRKWR